VLEAGKGFGFQECAGVQVLDCAGEFEGTEGEDGGRAGA